MEQTNPLSLNELFNRDPMSLSKIELEFMVEYFRKKRENFLVEERQVKSTPKARTTKPTVTLDMLKGIKL